MRKSLAAGGLAGMSLLLGSAAVGFAQDSAAVTGGKAGPESGLAMVRFEYERPGLEVPRFRVAVHEDGTGSYSAEEVAVATHASDEGRSAAATSHVERTISLTPATTAKIFKAARSEKYFQSACASKAKNIADTGAKMLRYEGPEGKGSCNYNYSEDKNVVMLTDLFLAIGLTLDEGRKLEFKRRFDHLGLDAELDVLTQANDAGRAVELNTIAPLLRELASDTEMMQRVRLRAAKLLERAADGR